MLLYEDGVNGGGLTTFYKTIVILFHRTISSLDLGGVCSDKSHIPSSIFGNKKALSEPIASLFPQPISSISSSTHATYTHGWILVIVKLHSQKKRSKRFSHSSTLLSNEYPFRNPLHTGICRLLHFRLSTLWMESQAYIYAFDARSKYDYTRVIATDFFFSLMSQGALSAPYCPNSI